MPKMLKILKIKNQMTLLTSALNSWKKGKLSAQPQPNPQVNNAASSSSHIEQAQNVITLQSEKKIDRPIPEVTHIVPDPDPQKTDEKDKEEKEASTSTKKIECPWPAPFPQRLKPLPKLEPNSEIYELFKQVKINIPLLDAIK